MKSLESIIDIYVRGLHLFNLDDSIERYGLIKNFKYACIDLYSLNGNTNPVVERFKSLSLLENTDEIITSLLDIKKQYDSEK